jgi:putative hydrolase of HD superfamily
MNILANLLFEVSTLRKIVRSHRAVLLTDDLSDNIASHSFLVTFAAYILAKEEKANIEKVLTMALVHDVPETRTGDIAWINKRYVKDFEAEAIQDMFSVSPSTSELIPLLKEYHERSSLEAKIVKDADRIAQMIVLREYEFAYGNQQAKEWTANLGKKWFSSFYTKSAEKLIKQLVKMKVNGWADGLASRERRKS